MAADVVRITDPQAGTTADVLISQGCNCFSWRPQLSDGPREMLWASDGFASGEHRPSSSGIPLLFPFPGRIGGAEFEFEGETYRLPPGGPHGNAIHGFTFTRAWRTIDQDESSITAEFQGSVDAPETLDSWPSDYHLRVQYRVDANRLVMVATYGNLGEKNLPCAFGTHAYFRLPLSDAGTPAETVIKAPVDGQWPLRDMLPVGEPAAVDAATPLADGMPLGEHNFDTPYRVIAGTNPIVTEIRDPASGRVLKQTTDGTFGCCVIYTPSHREAVCLEPYTCVPDPFRLEAEGQATGLQVLAPGESRTTEIVLELLES